MLASSAACDGQEDAASDGAVDAGVSPPFDAGWPSKAPSSPTDVKAIANVPRGATVTFGAPVGGFPVDDYVIETTPMDTSGAGGSGMRPAPVKPVVLVATATSGVVSGLSVGKKYVFRVTARNAYGETTSSSFGFVQVAAAVPAPPKPTACAGDGQALVFVKRNGGTVYNIHSSTTAGGAKPGATKLTVPKPGLVTVPIANGVATYFAVSAQTGLIESELSPEVRVEAKAFKPMKDVLFAASAGNHAIEMYDDYSGAGGAIPARIIQGPSTMILEPRIGSIQAVKSTGEVCLASAGGNRIDV